MQLERHEEKPAVVETVWDTTYGVKMWELEGGARVVGVSHQTWDDFLSTVQGMNFSTEIVVSPELITIASGDQTDISKEIVLRRTQEIIDLSRQFPKATFLLGTPIYEGKDKPTNGVLSIRSGKVIGTSYKRSPVTEWEKDNFTFYPDAKTFRLPEFDIGVVVCGDLTTAMIQSWGAENDATLLNSRKGNQVGSNVPIIDSKVRTLIIPSCWGVGGSSEMTTYQPADDYYRSTLQMTASELLGDGDNSVNSIVVVDRALPNPERFEGKNPLNAIFTIEKPRKRESVRSLFSWRRVR